jgi:hypothetical protein
MGEPIPTLAQWRSIPDLRRGEMLSTWSYVESARPLIEVIAADFMKDAHRRGHPRSSCGRSSSRRQSPANALFMFERPD